MMSTRRDCCCGTVSGLNPSTTRANQDTSPSLQPLAAFCSSQAGVFLSGGMDSSTILALSGEKATVDLNTFSYCCRAASFDESHYARAMSEFVGTNIATYLLGREASTAGSSLILTGDGGVELFAGHPVYEADNTPIT